MSKVLVAKFHLHQSQKLQLQVSYVVNLRNFQILVELFTSLCIKYFVSKVILEDLTNFSNMPIPEKYKPKYDSQIAFTQNWKYFSPHLTQYC